MYTLLTLLTLTLLARLTLLTLLADNRHDTELYSLAKQLEAEDSACLLGATHQAHSVTSLYASETKLVDAETGMVTMLISDGEANLPLFPGTPAAATAAARVNTVRAS